MRDNGWSKRRTDRCCVGSTSATEQFRFARSKRQPQPRRRPAWRYCRRSHGRQSGRRILR